MRKRSANTKQAIGKEKLTKKSLSSSLSATMSSFASTPRVSEVESLRQEVKSLKITLESTINEAESAKKRYQAEADGLKKAYAEVKDELETLRFEKDEKNVNQEDEDYTLLTLELISLRTEVDRLSYLYDKEKRSNNMRIMENIINNE